MLETEQWTERRFKGFSGRYESFHQLSDAWRNNPIRVDSNFSQHDHAVHCAPAHGDAGTGVWNLGSRSTDMIFWVSELYKKTIVFF